MTEFDQAYIRRGTLRKPTDLEQFKPVNTNTEYIDDLAKWEGRTIALIAIAAFVVWALENLA